MQSVPFSFTEESQVFDNSKTNIYACIYLSPSGFNKKKAQISRQNGERAYRVKDKIFDSVSNMQVSGFF